MIQRYEFSSEGYGSARGDLEFILEFLTRMRACVPSTCSPYTNSLRRSANMACYLSGLYMRRGCRRPGDYVDAAVTCSLPELKELAAKIAREILEGREERPRRSPSLQMGFSRRLQEVRVANAGSGQDRYLRWHSGLSSLWPEELLDSTAASIMRIAHRYSRLLESKEVPIGEMLRPYEPGDEPEAVDVDETINNLLERRRRYAITYDDIAVRTSRDRRRNVVVLHDISGSMGQSIIATDMVLTALSQAFLRSNLAVGLFRDDFYVMKELNDRVEPFQFAKDTLTLSSDGGTLLIRGLVWAAEQFHRMPHNQNVCFILGDFDFYEPTKTLEMLERLESRACVIALSVGRVPERLSRAVMPIDLLPMWLSSRTAEDFVEATLDSLCEVLQPA